MLDEHRSGCIIECGIGSLAKEVQIALVEYAKTNPVIYVTRSSQRIRKLLNLGEEEAARLESADREHRNCSNLEYYNMEDPSCGTETPPENGFPTISSRLRHAKADFSNFVDLITDQGITRSGLASPFSIAALPPECRSRTYALSIRLSSIPDLDLGQLESGADALQLKIDALLPDLSFLMAKQVATIRRKLEIPVIFYVEDYVFGDRSFSALEREDIYFSLLEFGLRLGVEYIVVDLKQPSDRVLRLVQSSGRTKVIGQYREAEGASGWDDEARLLQYRRATEFGCDLVRFVQATSKVEDNDAVQRFLDKVHSIADHLPVIAYNIGENGMPSLIANRIFTPVTHPIMESTISKSQIRQFLPTAAEAMHALFQSSVLNSLHFHTLGTSVFYSLSPAMHNAAYEVNGLAHEFTVLRVKTLEELHRVSQDPCFGGGAITQPYRVQLMDRLAAKSNHVKAIGAVNTLLPLRKPLDNSPLDGSTKSMLLQANQRNKAGRVLAYYGDNTDFIGILTCLRRSITPRNAVQPSKTTGLVIGAGGMARAAIYAMIQLGCRKIFIFNCAIENAESVAKHFNSWASGLSNDGEVVRVLKSRDEKWPDGYKAPTMIVSCVPARSVCGQPPANFEMPLQWMESPTGGVVVELSYNPPLETPLLAQVRRFREETKKAWVIVDGLEVLPEHAIAQFELFTGRKAPKRRMRLEVRQKYHDYEMWNDQQQ